jgi:hypothetical protein
MGLRFQKRIRIFKGLTLNLSKSGASFTVGGRGASVNFSKDKVTGNIGIPGTGLSYRQRLDKNIDCTEHETELPIRNNNDSNPWKALAIIFFIAFLIVLSELLSR